MTKNTFLFLPTKMLEGIIGILTTSFYASLFSLDAQGGFQFVNMNVQLLYLVSMAWLTNASVRYIGDELKKDAGRVFFSTLGRLYVMLATSVTMLSLCVYALTGDMLYLLAAFMYTAYSLFQIANAMLVQAGKNAWSIMLSLLSAILKLSTAFLFAAVIPVAGGYAAGQYPSPAPAVLAVVAGDLLCGIIAVFVLKIPRLARFRAFSGELFRGFFRYGFPLLGVSISTALLNTVDRYLVKLYYGDAGFAIYSSNNQLSTGVFTILSVAVIRGVYPAILAGWREGGRETAKPLLDSASRLFSLLALPCAMGLLAISNPLSRLLFAKPEYHTVSEVIGITAVAMVFIGYTEYAAKTWELTKKTVPVLINSAIAAGLKVVFSVTFLNIFGISGAALGTLGAFIGYFIISYFRARRDFAFSIPWLRFLRIFISALLCGAAAYALTLLPLGNALTVVVSILGGIIVYLVSLLVSGEIREEVAALIRRLKKKI